MGDPPPELDARWVKWGSDLTGIPAWAESDEEGFTIRMIEGPADEDDRSSYPDRSQERWYLSSWGDVIPEGQTRAEDIWPSIEAGEVEVITRAEFQSLWDEALEQRRAEWEEFKASHEVGERLVRLSRSLFPPHWVVVDLRLPFVGVLPLVDYQALAKRRRRSIGTRWRLKVEIQRFDDANQWVELKLVD